MKLPSADTYAITIKHENDDGEVYYVASVAEFPGLYDYANSYLEARELIIETINLTLEALVEQKIPFPYPSNCQRNSLERNTTENITNFILQFTIPTISNMSIIAGIKNKESWHSVQQGSKYKIA